MKPVLPRWEVLLVCTFGAIGITLLAAGMFTLQSASGLLASGPDALARGTANLVSSTILILLGFTSACTAILWSLDLGRRRAEHKKSDDLTKRLDAMGKKLDDLASSRPTGVA